MPPNQQRSDYYLLITAHALSLSALICVILTQEIPVPLWILALIARPASIMFRKREDGFLYNSIIIIAFIYSIVLFFMLETPFLIAFTQFLIVVEGVKLFHLKTAKDYFQLGGLSLLMVLATAGLTTQPYYILFIFLVLLFGIWFLFFLHLKIAEEDYPSRGRLPEYLTSPSLLFGISGVAICAFIMTILIFFTLPRITLSVTSRERWRTSTSGFSDVVDLASISPVRMDNRVVMRVEFSKISTPLPTPLFWRGVSFSSWNCRTWRREEMAVAIQRSERDVFRIETQRSTSDLIHQIVTLEPLGTDTLFYLGSPLEIRGNFSHIFVDKGGGIHLPSPPSDRCIYEVYSTLGTEATSKMSAKVPSRIYLQFPEDDIEIAALAKRIVHTALSPREKVERVIAYLHNTCRYSLDPKRDLRYSPLSDFLLHSREGYCEHFATAAAILLRMTGVPTRLVGGFLQGEWNPIGKYYMVRQRDAHTWIEAYLPEVGWVAFDPTPPTTKPNPVSALATLNRYYDFFKLKWHRYIIRYSRRDQIRILLYVGQRLRSLPLFPSRLLPITIKRHIVIIPLFLLAAGALCVVIIIAIRWKRKKLITLPPAEISFYMMFLRILEKKGISKRSTETPWEFAYRVGRFNKGISQASSRITSLYYSVRFGNVPLTKQEAQEAREIIKNLKKRSSFFAKLAKEKG